MSQAFEIYKEYQEQKNYNYISETKLLRIVLMCHLAECRMSVCQTIRLNSEYYLLTLFWYHSCLLFWSCNGTSRD